MAKHNGQKPSESTNPLQSIPVVAGDIETHIQEALPVMSVAEQKYGEGELYRCKIEGITHGKPLETLLQCLDEMELALVTVRDVIARNADGAPFEDSYIGMNLGLYVVHMDGIIRKCREILNQPPLVSHN